MYKCNCEFYFDPVSVLCTNVIEFYFDPVSVVCTDVIVTCILTLYLLYVQM